MNKGKNTPQAQPKWSREEQVLLVVEYFANKDDKLQIARSDAFLSEFLRKRAEILGKEISEKFRNEWGIHSQRENLSHFTQCDESLVTGHESAWMRKIVEEYLNNPAEMIQEAYEVLKKYMRL